MKRSIILGAVALLAAVACNKEAQAPVSAPEGRQVVVSAQREADTKVMYDNDQEFCWGKIEAIGMYVYPTVEMDYNPWIAPFDLVEGAGSNKGKFTATLPEGVDYGYVAVYPYTGGTEYNVATDELSFNLPAYYVDMETGMDDFYSARMPMAAKLDMAGDKGSFAFKNVGGLVKVTLTDVPSTARYFKLWAKSGGNISGTFTIKGSDIGTEYLASEGDANTVEYQLVEGANPGSEFEIYFPVPCGTFVFGIGVYDDNGFKFEKDGTAENTISRGTILKMPAVSMNDQPEQPGFPQNPPSGYCLIGEFGSYMWDHDVVLEQVPSNSQWFVAKNIPAAASGQIAFKFRADENWSSEFGAAESYHKQLNTKIALASSGASDIILEGTGTYDVYFSPLNELCFILTAGSAFAIPDQFEEKPAYDPATDVVVYADNQTGWGNNLRLYLWGTVNNLGGNWPGIESDATAVFGGTTYMRFVVPGALNKNYTENLIFNNNGSSQLDDLQIAMTSDAYFVKVTTSGATLLSDPR